MCPPESGEETDAEEDDEEDEEGYRDGENSRGAHPEVLRVEGDAPLWRKSRIYLTLPLNVRTYCYGESMETTLITTMGCTWTGEMRTTPYGSVVDAR